VSTLDTNVVVRLLIGDDPQQTPIAERAFLAAIASGGV
jgi:predicted nucleic-acid-binding protein